MTTSRSVPGKHAPADGRIFALGVFAHDVEVDVAGNAARKRRGDTGKQPDRTKIDVLVEFAAEFQKRSPQRNMVWNFVRKPDGAEEDRVMTADLVFPVFGQHVAMFGVIIVAGKIEMIVIQIDVEPAGHGLKNTKSFRHDFLADAVTGNDRDIESVLRHVWPFGP